MVAELTALPGKVLIAIDRLPRYARAAELDAAAANNWAMTPYWVNVTLAAAAHHSLHGEALEAAWDAFTRVCSELRAAEAGLGTGLSPEQARSNKELALTVLLDGERGSADA